MRARLWFAVLVVLFAAACGDDAGPAAVDEAAPTTTAVATVMANVDPAGFPLSPDPESAAAFSGNDAGVVAVVESIGDAAEVTTGPAGAQVTYGYTPVSVQLEEVLFGDLSVGDEVDIRAVAMDGGETSYVVGRRYVLLLNPAVDVEGTGEMATPNWAFLVDRDELLWSDPDVGVEQRMSLADFQALVDQRG
jgi:hypothetical protein